MIIITANGNDVDVKKIAAIIEDKKKAVSAYEDTRIAVMMAIKTFLTQSNKGFTAKELSDKFGLPVGVIARVARDYGIWTRDRRTTNRYVRLTDNGEVDLDDIKEITYKCKEYYVPTY